MKQTIAMMNTFKALLLMIGLSSIAATAALAHHSFGATYLGDREIRLEGRLVQFLFRNPHSFVAMEAPDENGDVQRWSIEWSGAGALTRQGVERGTLRVGDEIIITGRPSRTPGEFRAQMLSLVRPADGLSWGNRPGEVID